jgi:uncharacterized protein (TIGR02145 family)
MGKILICFTLFYYIPLFGQTGSNKNSYTDPRDGKTYNTVKIRNQVWMSENLAYKEDSACWIYQNDEKNIAQFGYLYNWEMAQKVCPTGWKLPSKSDFKKLIKNVGKGDDSIFSALLPNGNSGYSVIFGGCHLNENDFEGIEEVALFWSSSTYSDRLGLFLLVRKNDHLVGLHGYDPASGFSVRCIRRD